MYLWAMAIYKFPWSVYPVCCTKNADRALRIYKSLTDIHECRNWVRGRAVSFLGIFVSNLLVQCLCSALAKKVTKKIIKLLINYLACCRYGFRTGVLSGVSWTTRRRARAGPPTTPTRRPAAASPFRRRRSNVASSSGANASSYDRWDTERLFS